MDIKQNIISFKILQHLGGSKQIIQCPDPSLHNLEGYRALLTPRAAGDPPQLQQAHTVVRTKFYRYVATENMKTTKLRK